MSSLQASSLKDRVRAIAFVAGMVLAAPAFARQVFGPQPARASPLTIVEVEARGDIVLVGADGARVRPKTGTIELWSRYHCKWHRQEIAVVEGRWTANVPSPIAWAVVERVVLDGRESYVERGGWDGTPPAQSSWTARLVAPVHLHVVDSVRGEPVNDFEVREWDRATPPLDGNDGWIATTRGSRSFRLPAWSLDPDPEPLTGHGWSARRSFWVRAPGRAWTRIEADSARGGIVVARLAPAAALRAVMSANTRSLTNGAHAWFEIEFPKGSATKSVDPALPVIEFANLEPGPVTLRWLVLNESPRKPPRVLALRRIQLEAGPTTIVEF